MTGLLWLSLIPLFAAADRIVGSDMKNPKSLGNGLVIVPIAAMSVLGAWGGVAMAAAWLLYRNLPWAIGGTTTPRTTRQALGALARHSMPCAAAAICWLSGLLPGGAVFAFLLFAPLVTVLDLYRASDVDARAHFGLEENLRLNTKIELCRGALFGSALTLIGMR